MKQKFDVKKFFGFARWGAVGVLVVILVLMLFFSNAMWYQIEEQEQAVLVTLGKPRL